VRREYVEVYRELLAAGYTAVGEFHYLGLAEAHAAAEAAGSSFTDDATMLHWAGFEVRTVEGDASNTKITTLADLVEADRRMGGVRA
jgi:2-C-methyl-D-erythritol 4-phosphate cytidylyltransferase